MRGAQVFVRGEAKIISTADYPLGECSHCPFVVVAPLQDSKEEGEAGSDAPPVEPGSRKFVSLSGGHTLRALRLLSSSPGPTSEAHTNPSSSTGDRDFYPASQCSDVEADELDHSDALDAAGLKDDGGPDAEQFLDRRRGARASTT